MMLPRLSMCSNVDRSSMRKLLVWGKRGMLPKMAIHKVLNNFKRSWGINE